jgi:hypothetical protein
MNQRNGSQHPKQAAYPDCIAVLEGSRCSVCPSLISATCTQQTADNRAYSTRIRGNFSRHCDAACSSDSVTQFARGGGDDASGRWCSSFHCLRCPGMLHPAGFLPILLHMVVGIWVTPLLSACMLIRPSAVSATATRCRLSSLHQSTHERA